MERDAGDADAAKENFAMGSLFKREEPWRATGGFGLASILNRPSAAASGSGAPAPALPLPKFSLPALHSFSKPLAQSEPLHAGGDRSILNDSADGYEYSSQQQQTPQQSQSGQDRSPEATPSKANSASGRRIAPAPVDEEENEQEEELGSSIRGGRWTADEHERFLEGFRVHGHKWKRVQQVVRTRSVTQVRTHAQKYLLKVAKLKAEKKQQGKADGGVYMATQGRVESSSDAEPSNAMTPSPDRRQEMYLDDNSQRSPKRISRKKIRKLEHGASDPVDQEYIAAAATTLCFLMTQKIDSLFDSRHDLDSKDVEPYDCYSQEQEPAAYAAAEDEHYAQGNSRKRSYMHFITESPTQYEAESVDYRSYDNAPRTEASSYSLQGKKLCS